MKKLLAAFLAATIAVPGSAAVIRYNLNGVTFDDGGTFTGYFDYDTDAYGQGQQPFVSFDLTSSATLNFASHHYLLSNGGTIASNQYAVGFLETPAFNPTDPTYFPPTNGFNFYTLNEVSLAGGGSLLLDSAHSTESSNEGLTRYIVSGTIDAPLNDVPEPAMLGLFGLGAIGLGLGRRRKS